MLLGLSECNKAMENWVCKLALNFIETVKAFYDTDFNITMPCNALSYFPPRFLC